MAETNGDVMTLIEATTQDLPAVVLNGARVRTFIEEIQMNNPATGQDNGDTIVVGRIPAGSRAVLGYLLTDTTLGAATLSVGTRNSDGSGSPAAANLRAAAVLTTINAPQFYGVSAGINEDFSVQTDIFLTIGAADLPGTGILKVATFFVID